MEFIEVSAKTVDASSDSASVIAVIMKPGAIALARMPREPNSCAIDFANAIIPALEAE